MRESGVWLTMLRLTHCTVCGLMAMTVKQHNQQLLRPAQTLQQLLGKETSNSKGNAKGATKGMSKGKENKRS